MIKEINNPQVKVIDHNLCRERITVALNNSAYEIIKCHPDTRNEAVGRLLSRWLLEAIERLRSSDSPSPESPESDPVMSLVHPDLLPVLAAIEAVTGQPRGEVLRDAVNTGIADMSACLRDAADSCAARSVARAKITENL